MSTHHPTEEEIGPLREALNRRLEEEDFLGGDFRLEEVRAKFLHALMDEAKGYVNLALQIVGGTLASAYRWRKKDPEFKRLWDECAEAGRASRVVTMEATAYQSRFIGTAVPVYRPLEYWSTEEADPNKVRTPMQAVQFALRSKNLMGWMFVPPNPKGQEFLMKAEMRDKYNPPRVPVNITIGDRKAFFQELAREFAESGTPCTAREVEDTLKYMHRRFMKGELGDGNPTAEGDSNENR